METLRARGNVDWTRAETAFEEWDYETQGLTEAGALLVTLVASYALGPGIDTLAANLGGNSAAMTAAFDAGLTSLSNQAAVALVNNRGNLGAALKELGSSEALRSLATAMVGAGLSTQLIGAAGLGGDLPAEAALTDRLTRELQVNLIRASVNTALDVAVQGQGLDEALRANLRGAAAATLGTAGAQEIGKAAASGDVNRALQLVAHAALGCATAAVGSDDCSSGAIGAFSGELAALLYTDAALRDPSLVGESLDRWQERGILIAELTGGLLAAAAGGSADVGAGAAGNAAENNALWVPILIAAYLTYEGEGNPVQGLILVGQGEDIGQRLLAAGGEKALQFASAQFPKETAAVLDAAAAAGELASVGVTYLDRATGQYVSTGWNNLSPDVQDAIRGGATVASILIPAGAAGRVGMRMEAPNSGAVAHYGPLNPGPLPNDIARTFRSGTYQEVVTAEPTTLYRVISDNGNPAGGYWTRTRPEGPLQSVIDSALDQNWGNTATRVVQMEVPAGTRLFEGVAAPQRGLVGGGNQIYFDRTVNPLDPSWIK
jgi:filamentous hemagglutinin